MSMQCNTTRWSLEVSFQSTTCSKGAHWKFHMCLAPLSDCEVKPCVLHTNLLHVKQHCCTVGNRKRSSQTHAAGPWREQKCFENIWQRSARHTNCQNPLNKFLLESALRRWQRIETAVCQALVRVLTAVRQKAFTRAVQKLAAQESQSKEIEQKAPRIVLNLPGESNFNTVPQHFRMESWPLSRGLGKDGQFNFVPRRLTLRDLNELLTCCQVTFSLKRLSWASASALLKVTALSHKAFWAKWTFDWSCCVLAAIAG